MIAYLNGVVTQKDLDSIVLDVHGVGYGIRVTGLEHTNLIHGSEAKLYVYEHIREDAHDLYGFQEVTGKQLFEQLLSVKNVGPKVALAVMSLGNETTVRSAIATGDIKQLQTAKGVGKRAAEQMVVELRDKVGLATSAGAEDIVGRSGVDASDEAVQALLSLGYSEVDAQAALAHVSKDLPTEERVTMALKEKR